MAKRKADKETDTGARQGKLEPEKTNKQADDWELKGWLNRSKSGKMIKISLLNGEDSIFLGLVSVKQVERLLADEVKGVAIKTPPEQEEN